MDEVKQLLEEAQSLDQQATTLMQQSIQKRKEAINLMTPDADEETRQQADTMTAEADMMEVKAEQAQKAAADIKKLAEHKKAMAQVTLPAPLPTGGENGAAANKDAEIMKTLYVSRFGDDDSSVKAIIRDIHGNDYEQNRYDQTTAFYRYMKAGDRGLDQQQATLLRRIIVTPGYVHKAINNGASVGDIKSTMVEAVDTLGGYLVPEDFRERIIERLSGLTAMRGRAQVEQTSRDSVTFPRATGGDSQYTSAIRNTWVDETPTSSASETNATFGSEKVPVHTLMSLVPLSKDILEDSVFNLARYIETKFAEAKAITEDNAFLTGNGVGKPQGIIPGGTSLAAGVSAIKSGNASALTFDGLLDLIMGIDTQYHNNAVIIGKRATYNDIIKLNDGSGQYLWTEMRGDNVSANPTKLRGYDVIQQESLPAVAAGTYPLIFGDPQGYMIVDRMGMQVTRYDVNPGENIVKFEMKSRVGGQVIEPWRFAVQEVGTV